MTDQYVDGHTSSVILRGGSNYRPSGSGWYLPQTLRGVFFFLDLITLVPSLSW
jgi:hypothetical protein|eukprot:COSAG06_NODE_4424_length_4280_cov_6.770390_2_plen_53_part_00